MLYLASLNARLFSINIYCMDDPEMIVLYDKKFKK